MRESRLVLWFAAAPLLAGNGELLTLAPPNPGLLAGIRVEKVAESKFGSSVLDTLQDRWAAPAGFDLRRDVREALIATVENHSSRGLILLAGTFDPSGLRALAKAPGTTAAAFRGVEVLTTNGMSLACIDRSVIAMGDPESVLIAISRYRQRGASPPLTLLRRVEELSAAHDAWLLVRAPLAELMGALPAGEDEGATMDNLFASMEQISGGVRFGPEVQMSLDIVSKTTQDAENMASALKMVLELVASKYPSAAALTPIVETMDLRAEGKSVKMAAVVLEDDLARAFRPVLSKARPKQPRSTEIIIESSPHDMGVVKLPAQPAPPPAQATKPGPAVREEPVLR